VSLKKLGRYDLIRVLGKGAMGIVYEGRDPNLERRVAIKTVKVENLSEQAAAEYEHRFRTEARSAARLQHPNIVSVYDSDRDGNVAFLVMEYIHGDDLKYHLDKGERYSLEQSLKMIRDLLSALDYAHKQGIVHRDVKPANLLIEPGGRLKLTDFGVARIQDSGEATRTQGSMVGTLKYMAPEQVQGEKIDARADLFSVGVVLYQLLTDKRPFDGDNDFSIIHQIIGHNPPPPSEFNAGLPAAIDAVVARALAKDRDQRFATARDFAAALQSAIRRAEDQTVVPPANPSRRTGTAATGSRAGQSAAGGGTSPSSTVTQEVELVYWKDIKDSDEAEEFESFLAKFPAGIYADLARKRLRRLTSADSFDKTLMSGAAAYMNADAEATRARAGTISLPDGGPPQESMASRTDRTGTDFPATVIEDPSFSQEAWMGNAAEQAGPASLPTAAPQSAGAVDAAVEAGPASATTASTASTADPTASNASTRNRRSSRPMKASVAMFAGLGAFIVLGAAAFMVVGQGEAPSPDTSALARASVTAASPTGAASASGVAAGFSPSAAAPSAVAPASAAQSFAAAGPSLSASVASASSIRASADRGPASAVKPKSPVPQPMTPAVRPAVVSTAAQREDPGRVPRPAAPTGPSPVDACKDKMFLSREFCLSGACENPGARTHPLCVKWREEKRLREDSKLRQGPQ